MSDITLKKVAKYYKKDQRGKLADKVIMKELKGSGEIVYGARSVNAVVPSFLKKHTEDWDIYTDDDPRIVAHKIEKALDKRYGDNFFSVAPAKHEGTYKIKSRVTDKEVADVTFQEDDVEHRKVGGINYATLDYQVTKLRAALAKEEAKYRHDRDKETLQRILVFNEYVKEKKKPKRKVTPKIKKGKSYQSLGKL
jgi:hypothetical protein